MKATSRIQFATLLLTGMVVMPMLAGAQAKNKPEQTALTAQVANSKTTTMSFDRVRSITTGAIKEAIGTQLGNVNAESVAKQLSGSYEALRAGATVGFHSPVSSLASHSITEQHVMQVKVGYEPRPIGGILTVRVELVPVFAGIGSASRPIVVREVSQAVDNFDEDGLGDMVADLSHQIGTEYAAK